MGKRAVEQDSRYLMRRFALLMLGVLIATWLEFEFLPGHSYLEADSQTYVPVLERLDAPGYLSRDLLATHVDVAYTIYDELTLFLHEAGRLKFKTALQGQQLFCRAAALTGVLLLALSAGLSDVLALLIASFANFGAMLYGPAILLVDHEPVPRTFAFALILLAAGLLVREKPLLAGLAGGMALVYQPVISAPFWGAAIVAFAADRRLRRVLRPAMTILAIFILLLANLSQLQPGVAESASLWGKLTGPVAAVQQYRTPNTWVSLWATSDLWSGLAIYVCGLWATVRIWRTLNRALQWLLLALPLGGILSLAISYITLERLRWQLIPAVQPAQAEMFTVAFSSLACGIAGAQAAVLRKRWEATLWFVVVFAVPVNSRILNLLRVTSAANLLEVTSCIALAAAVVVAITRTDARPWRYAVLLVPVIAALTISKLPNSHAARGMDERPILELAAWAEESTWGSSMFLFPDSGRDLYPATFRAESRRAVWADWSSGELVDYSGLIALEWRDRWEQTMQGTFSLKRLEKMLSLPIDYFVLKRSHQLGSVKPVFRNSDFVVYDASDLRQAMMPLSLAAHHAGGG